MSDDEASSRVPISPLRKWTIRLVVWAVMLTPLLLWPKVVGGALLAIIIFAAALWYFIKWKFKKFFGQLGEAIGDFTAVVGPFAHFHEDMVLLPVEEVKFQHPREAIGHREALRGLGFEFAGNYQVDKVDDVTLSAFCHPGKRLWAILYDFEAECALDVLGRKLNGSFFAATSYVPDLLEENARNAPMARCKDEDAASLLMAAEEQAEEADRAEAGAETFSELFFAYIQARRVWLFGDREAEEQRQKALRVAFLEQSGWTALEWDRKQGRVFFVHDNSDVDTLVYQLLEIAGFQDEEDDGDEGEEDAYERESKVCRAALMAEPLRKSFRAQLEARGLQDRCPVIMTLEGPVTADAYLGPFDSDM